MRTPTSAFTTEKNKAASGVAPYWLLEIVTGGGTLYYSDKNLTVSGQAYTDNILAWGNIRNQILAGDGVRVGGTTLKLANNPRIDNLIKSNQTVTIYQWFAGMTSADKFVIFKGTVSDDIQVDEIEISLTCLDIGQKFDKVIGTPLSLSDWPNADPDDVGKIWPIVLGDCPNVRGLAIDAGAVSTLAADIAAGATTITLTDVSRFPTTGTVTLIIGAEEDITYNGISGKTLQNVQNVSNAYSRGVRVMQKKSSIKFGVSEKPAKAITNARIVPDGKGLKDAVVIPAGSVTYNLNDSGRGTITLNDMAAIRRAITIATQPAVTPVFDGVDNKHKHQQAGNTTITYFCDNITGTITGGSGSNTENMVNKNFTSTGFIAGWTSFNLSCSKLAIEQYAGTVKKVRSLVTCYLSSGTGVQLQMKLYVNGTLKETKNISPTGSMTTYATSWYDVTMGWTDFNNANTYIEVSDADGNVTTLIIGEVWYEVQYQPEFAEQTLTTNRTTDVALNGNSAADILGGYLIADVQGTYDDLDCTGQTDGHYTGASPTLIEKPWHVIHYLIEAYSNGAVHADIDIVGSFADCNTNLPSTWKFSFVVTEQIKLNELLSLLARQTFCRFGWEWGLARLIRIKTAYAAGKTITVASDTRLIQDGNGAKVGANTIKPDLSLIKNDITIKYNLDTTLGGWDAPDAYAAYEPDSDSGSITTYGNRKWELLAFAVRLQPMADTLAANYLSLYASAKQMVFLPLFLEQLELETGDIINVVWPYMSLDATGAWEITNLEITPPDSSRMMCPEINVEASFVANSA